MFIHVFVNDYGIFFFRVCMHAHMGRGDHMHEDKLGVPLNYLSPLRQDFSLAWSSTKIAEILQSPPSLQHYDYNRHTTVLFTYSLANV